MRLRVISLAIILSIGLSSIAIAREFVIEPICKVQICNKLERFTLNIWTYIRDQIGEECHDVIIPKEDAIVGKVLSSESRWFQGSTFNPTKQSVTRVKEIYICQEIH